MDPDASARLLSEAEVLVIDCQATGAAPRGHLLEIGWARSGATIADARACLIKLPDGEHIAPAVTRVTGIDDRMMRAGLEPCAAWRAIVAAAATFVDQPPPTVIHFARFEQPFLRRLAGGAPPFDVICTHAIAARLLPGLPRRSLRALAGYFGRSVGVLRRSADHVQATAFVWGQLVALLEAQGISTWDDLKSWLAATPVESARRRRRVWPMPRDVRLALPDAPGIYRMLRSSGDVLYVGKAASLRARVNSYFRHRRGVPERTLEMLSQVRAISFEVTPSPLEAALLEPDEIKRFRPPYNVALTGSGRSGERGDVGMAGDRHLWFATPDLIERRPRACGQCPVGPFPSAETLEQFAALAGRRRDALGRGRWAPDTRTFEEGYARLRAAHAELSLTDVPMSARLLQMGTRLWREGRRDRDVEADDASANDRRAAEWTAETVQLSLEWLAIRAALARRRATWLTRLAEASIAWREPGADQHRLVVLENGGVILRAGIAPDAMPPAPPGHARPGAERREAFTVARFDRLRVLSTELKRLIAARAPVAVRFGASPPLDSARLARVLAWV